MTSGAFYFPMLRKRARILARTYKRLLALPVLSWVCYPSSQIEYDRNSFCRVTGRARTPNSPIFLFLMRGPARASLSLTCTRSCGRPGRAQDLVLLYVSYHTRAQSPYGDHQGRVADADRRRAHHAKGRLCRSMRVGAPEPRSPKRAPPPNTRAAYRLAI